MTKVIRRHVLSLKQVSIRLDIEEYEKLKEYLSEYGDPELNVAYLLRMYIRDLNKAMPNLSKSALSVRNNIAFWGEQLRNMNRLAEIEAIMKGRPIVHRVSAEEDDEKRYWGSMNKEEGRALMKKKPEKRKKNEE